MCVRGLAVGVGALAFAAPPHFLFHSSFFFWVMGRRRTWSKSTPAVGTLKHPTVRFEAPKSSSELVPGCPFSFGGGIGFVDSDTSIGRAWSAPPCEKIG